MDLKKPILFICYLIGSWGIPSLGQGQEGGAEAFRPSRDISIIVTEEGYYPDRISVYEGESVQLYVTSLTKKPHCFVLPTQNVFLAAEKGKISGALVYFHDSGRFKFYCPGGKIDGYITVLRKDEQGNLKTYSSGSGRSRSPAGSGGSAISGKGAGRAPAMEASAPAEIKPKEWMPRDF